METDFKWLDEKVEKTPQANWLYRIICFLFFRHRMTYKDLYLVLRGLNEKELGVEETDKRAFKKIIEIYKYNNGTLPLGI